MSADTLRNLDLNLLITLDVLLQERNVTRTAARLGVSQPTVSAALARLRRHFSDDLLRRVGNRYEPTPLAEQLTTTTAAAVSGVRRVFEATPTFDPETSEHEFTVVMSDYAAAIYGDLLVTTVAERAPGVRLRLEEQNTFAVDHALEFLRSVDGMILPHGFLTDIPALDLFEDRWVCVVAESNESVGDAVTLDDMSRLPMVVTYHAPTAFTPAVRQLQMLGVEPKVQVVVSSFCVVPFLVAGTNRIAVLQARLAERLADAAGVRIVPCPWDVVPLTEALWWHPVHRGSPAHRWLRSTLQEAARPLAAGP